MFWLGLFLGGALGAVLVGALHQATDADRRIADELRSLEAKRAAKGTA